MFQKTTFGTGTSGFGSFNAGASTSSPFGGFKPPASTSTFGAPAFGATTAQSAAGGGLFGSSNTSGGLFGGTPATSAPAFGATTGGFGGFGANTSAGGGLFGSTQNTGTGLFGNTQNTSAFGAKPAGGFGFGSTTTTGTTGGGLFGGTTGSTGLFGQNNATMSGGGLFSNTTGAFGQQQASGTAHVKYNPLVGTDTVAKSGTTQTISIKHHCITCMKEYENKSLEELRLEDYVAGRKGNVAAGSMFGGFQQQPTETKPLFPAAGAFGQPATTSAPSVFGGGGLNTTGGFGQTSTFSFGGNTQNSSTTGGGLFGASKPAFGATATPGTGLFGATTTQAPAFGTTNTSTFGGFGANTQNQSGGLFGAKPATTGFNSAPAASSGFGAFGSGGGLFGAKPQQTTAPTFGTATPAFGQTTGAFGANTSTSGGLFGGNTSFGKPATTQPAFGFGAPSTGLGTGLGGTLSANTFGAKPAATPFGGLGTTLGQQQQVTQFKTGLEGGLGGGLFGNTSTLGGGNTSFNAFNANTSSLANNLSGASAAGNVHEQILTLAARPYGDSPLFKDLLPDSSTTAEDVLKPTNPAAVKAVLDSSNSYRVTSPTVPRLKVQPRPSLSNDKKSLFDGLEESDASLEDKLTLKPSRKRLVLRPTHGPDAFHHDSTEQQQQKSSHTSRTAEETQPETNGSRTSLDKAPPEHHLQKSDSRRSTDLVDSANEYSVSDKHGSWITSPPNDPWRDKEKPIDGEPTPRLYPNLDKEMPIQISERRASWLNTKHLRKPLNPYVDTIENSARDLGLRPDKDNIDNLSVSEEENVQPRDVPPHPTGVKLTRPGYYTIPTLDEMIGYMKSEGTCVVPNLTIGRKNYGNVFFDCEIDVAGMDLDALVHFLNKEVIVYPEDADKPAVGQGLNRRAIVTLDRVWPRDKTEKKLITDPDRLIKMDYEGKLRRVCEKHDTKFIEYRAQTGSWVFRVEHFSKYGLTDSDEEEEMAPDVLKRQIANQSLQKAAPPAPPKPPAAGTSSGLGGLGGLASMPTEDISGNDSLFAMHQTSLNLLNGAGKAFEMDTTEDNHEPLSFYQESSTTRAYGVKSPTSELARLEHRQSHHVQLMKASLYADVDMEDDISVSTGDQLVPQPTTMSVSLPTRPPSIRKTDAEIVEETQIPVITDEAKMPPLILIPHSIVLKYHGKVPPFKKTIAGCLDAACISDLSIGRARHTRCGFGPGGVISYVTSYDSVSDLSKSSDLYDLGRYMEGRAENDWSESVVSRIGIGQADDNNATQDILARHLDTLFKYSSFAECQEDMCPRLVVSELPNDRLSVLRGHIKNAKITCEKYPQRRFGVSSDYCYEVWSLCEALWGLDLENDGIPGTDEHSIVERHKRLLEWMTSAVSIATDDELSKPKQAELEDESDCHSVRIWTLLLGGRILEACKVAKDNGDLNMAVLIAQCAGDSIFQALVARQLSLWRECGADSLIASHRLATLRLLAAQCDREQFMEVDWLRTLHATARYLCPQVSSLEQIIRKYESFFVISETNEQEQIDLSLVIENETGMQYPLPPYIDQYDVNVYSNGHKKRILDIRYDLLRARAFNGRPKLRPAAYTPDPMDYILCFLLGTWFGNPTIESITGLAEQLESCGAWHLAINALAYHPNDAARGHLIRGVLNRHAPSTANTAELQSRIELVKKLRVPEKWLLLAQAYRAKYEHQPAIEATHLVGAAQWNAAHKVLLEELLPEAVLADDLQSISPLLEKINEAAKRHEVSGWESGGQALYHYLHVCEEIRSVVLSAEGAGRATVTSRLEALRPRLAAACRALAALGATPKSPRHAAARAEMGARLVQLAIAAGEPPHHLAALLKALKLPPDCTAHVQHKITTELAQQADLSIESTSSSPPTSSRQRAIAME